MFKYYSTDILEVLEGADNYNQWIAESILPYVNSPALEIGSGIGNITTYFLNKKPLYVTDKDETLIKHLKKRFSKINKVYVSKFDITKNSPSHYKSNFASAFAVNVLEHIKNDKNALLNIRETLRDNGRLILLVPAKKFAYNKLDNKLGHFRRYEKKEIIDKLENTGYIIEKIYYFNFVGLISWIVRDLVERNNISLTNKQITIFDSIVPFLRKIELIINIPIGISLIIIAKKV